MTEINKLLACIFLWISGITGLHLALNVDWMVILNDRLPENQRRLNVAYIPVT